MASEANVLHWMFQAKVSRHGVFERVLTHLETTALVQRMVALGCTGTRHEDPVRGVVWTVLIQNSSARFTIRDAGTPFSALVGCHI